MRPGRYSLLPDGDTPSLLVAEMPKCLGRGPCRNEIAEISKRKGRRLYRNMILETSQREEGRRVAVGGTQRFRKASATPTHFS
jgi:hypothetical protein